MGKECSWCLYQKVLRQCVCPPASSLCSTSTVVLQCQMGQKCSEFPESLLALKLSDTFILFFLYCQLLISLSVFLIEITKSRNEKDIEAKRE